MQVPHDLFLITHISSLFHLRASDRPTYHPNKPYIMDTDEPHNGSSSQTHVPLSIYGSVPGVIDPSQPARLLSDPNSKLSFASFHPRTASSHQDPRKLSTREELCSSRRIVIETLPSGESFWRWVPRAKGVENVEDEGQWPRVVEICGYVIFCCSYA